MPRSDRKPKEAYEVYSGWKKARIRFMRYLMDGINLAKKLAQLEGKEMIDEAVKHENRELILARRRELVGNKSILIGIIVLLKAAKKRNCFDAELIKYAVDKIAEQEK